MSMTGLDVFDHTVQETNNWLKDLMMELNWDDRHRAYLALRSCLHALRDRVNPDEAVDLGAQLPMLVRGFYYEGWKPSKTPEKIRTKDEFLDKVSAPFDQDPAWNSEEAVRAIFKLMFHRATEGEIQHIKSNLPGELQELWPQRM